MTLSLRWKSEIGAGRDHHAPCWVVALRQKFKPVTPNARVASPGSHRSSELRADNRPGTKAGREIRAEDAFLCRRLQTSLVRGSLSHREISHPILRPVPVRGCRGHAILAGGSLLYERLVGVMVTASVTLVGVAIKRQSDKMIASGNLMVYFQ